MFERLNTPEEAYNYKLRAALTMEKTVLDILDSSIEEAQSAQVRALLQTHRRETEQHVEILEQVFGAMEWEIDDSPCPAIDGLKAEAKAVAKKTDDSLLDNVILQGAAEVEHHEIGVYANLMMNAKAMGRDDVFDLLEKNQASERDALKKVMALLEQVASAVPKAA